MAEQYFGKYRGTVTNNVDPLKLGRIQVIVPDVVESVPTNWAMPCFAGPGMFAVPSIGAAVWIEFEKGDAGYPVWTGCYYHSAGDVPRSAEAAILGQPFFCIQAPGGSFLVIMDGVGEAADIVIGFQGGAKLSISDSVIQLESGKGSIIRLVGPAVDVNHGALEVV